MADLAKFKSQRGQLKSKLTRTRTFYDSLDISEIDDAINAELVLRLEKTEPIFDEFNHVQSEIEFLANSEAEEKERDEFEKSYFQLIANIRKTIHTFSMSSLNTQNSINITSPSPPGDQAIRLPTIKLPTFNGHYDQWLEFRDAFNAIIQENKTISDIQKFYYLRSSLEGDACKIIQSIKASEANYVIAWQLLKDRFENKRLIVHNHVKAIFDLPVIQKESHTELRNLFDNVTKHLRSLKALGEPTEHWDTLIVHIITNKLDSITRREWESYETKNELPQMEDINKFLKHRCELLEKLEFNKTDNQGKVKNRNYSNAYLNTNNNGNNVVKLSCYFCKKPHTIYNCDIFLKYSPSARINEAKKHNLCINCLKPDHIAQQCNSSKCRKCGRKHNTMLHIEYNVSGNETSARSSSSTSGVSANVPSAEATEGSNGRVTVVGHSGQAVAGSGAVASQVVLSTAMVRVKDRRGQFYECRALLDSGSQSNFVTDALCKKLNLQLQRADYSIAGVGQALANVSYTSELQLFSNNNSYNVTISCLVLPRITENLPTISFDKSGLKIPQNIQLADPSFNQSNPVDILLGANIFWQLLCVGQFQLDNTLITLQKTRLGWVVAGRVNDSMQQYKSISCFNTELNNKLLDNQLTKFWQLEEVQFKTRLSESEQYCESHFLDNFKRHDDGRFIVSIPLKNNAPQLGQSREFALQRFFSQERKLIKNAHLYSEYKKFMAEYEQLGHMSVIQESDFENELNYYLPHHAVVKDSSTTTRVRVVFDASMKSDSGLSLNDIQYSGFPLQNDIFSIILRFRKHKYVLTADISKMYRMVIVNSDQRRFQRIFWRDDPANDLKCYELSTVTYGMASAPYLATRCLYQLAVENEKLYPFASNIIKHDFYVDDCLTGSDSETELLQIQHDISKILSSAGFELRKWLTNKMDLCGQFHLNNNLEASIVQLGEHESNKTLGILWNATLDNIQYSISDFNKKPISKRTILSVVSQIFDPLGLLGPFIILAKLLIQQLWQAKISWDEAIPQNLHTIWSQFHYDFHTINDIKIPRHVLSSEYASIELHGFADASERAYGAAIYILCVNSAGQRSSKLLCAKSRVAPIRQITLPRLELCSAVLLAQLVEKCTESIKIKFDKSYFWSDSTIALSWIRAAPSRWKTFVANRVSEIQRVTDVSNWYHVNSKDNPADLISRGISSNDLLNSKLWWTGPAWLTNGELQNQLKVDNIDFRLESIPEQKTIACVAMTNNDFINLFSRFSSLRKLQGVYAYCRRFISNLRVTTVAKTLGPLTSQELQASLYDLVRLAQQSAFPQDYDNLKNRKPLNKKSNLLSLNPFLDNNEIIRVGGRIQNSSSEFDKKHPIILPTKHKLTSLILEQEHLRLLHCGPTMLLSSIRERFWPISGRNLCKKIVHQCVTCFKAKPSSDEYLMGNLPDYRVNQYVPFYNTGIDFAGPFLIKDRNTRGAKLTKAYICLFICLGTKAIHIELVSDLTTDCFLASFHRFMGRRAKPLNIYTDNGRTFVGANAKVNELSDFFNSSSEKIIESLASDNINWHFIPARAPNFGGIWEAGVKSVKYHLKRVLGNAHLNFEGLSTVLIQIESILNSRPLCQLSSNPDQLDPLTPAHFLIGKRLTALPEPSLIDIPDNRLNRYQKLQQLVQHFWSRWHKEYLSELQTRVKWKQNVHNYIKEGTIVLMKEDNAPPMRWHIGQVIQLHPGKDGVLRVVSLKVNDSVVKRPVSKLCVFPFEKDNAK